LTDQADRWTLTFQAAGHGPPTEIRVRRALKWLLRAYGLRCTSLAPAMDQADLAKKLRERAARWRTHAGDHGPDAVLEHRLLARADEAEAIAAELCEGAKSSDVQAILTSWMADGHSGYGADAGGD